MKRTTWTLIMAGLLTAGLGLHLIVAQPLDRQMRALTEEVDTLRAGMRQLADFRDEVAGTNDLLSGLQLQSQQINQARSAVENIRRLDREIRLLSESTSEARVALTDIAKLQSELIAQREQIDALRGTLDELACCEESARQMAGAAEQELADIELAEDSLRQLGNFHQRVAIASSGIDVAENRFSRLVGLKRSIEGVPQSKIDLALKRLADLDGIADQIVTDGQQAEEARGVAGQLLALQDDIVGRAQRVDVARRHADQLLNLEDTLANGAARDVDAAANNLAALLKIEERLATQDEPLAAAVESLELLEDLHNEFVQRTQDLDSIRRGLTELILMESMVARTVQALKPLTELTDLRRLDPEQLRSIARGIMEANRQRMALDDAASPAVSHPAVRSESALAPREEARVPAPPAE